MSTPDTPGTDLSAVAEAWHRYETARTAASAKFALIDRIATATRDAMIAAELPDDTTSDAEREASAAIREAFAYAVWHRCMETARTDYMDAVSDAWSDYWELAHPLPAPDPATDAPALVLLRSEGTDSDDDR